MPEFSGSPVAPEWWRRFSRGVRRGVRAFGDGGPVSGTIEDYVGVIPVLAGQIRETASAIEHSALEITSRFASLVGRARRAASSARGATSARAAAGNVDELVDSSRRTLQQLLDHSVRNAEMSFEAVARLDEVVKAMKTIGTTANEVDRIAFSMRILAFNATTDSVHEDERGAGLAGVAGEISQHADQATAVAEGLRGTVAEIEKGIAPAMHYLRQLAETDMTSLIQNKDEADRVIGLLAEDVSRAVVAMQIQDHVSQRLQHVVETLTEMQQDFSAALAGSAPGAATGGTAVTRLRLRYTRAAERMAERAAPASGGEVELC